MRHRVAHRKLGRVTEHRLSLLRNQATALIRHERIRTTVPKAKELRPFVERIISIAKRSLDAPEGSSAGVTARRRVAVDIADRAIVRKLFETIAPRFAERPGGYTRLLRVGHRRGDGADMAEVEFIGSEFDPTAATTESGEVADVPEQAKKKGVGDRLRAALGGGRKGSKADSGAKVEKGAKGGGKVTTPRKAGGS